MSTDKGRVYGPTSIEAGFTSLADSAIDTLVTFLSTTAPGRRSTGVIGVVGSYLWPDIETDEVTVCAPGVDGKDFVLLTAVFRSLGNLSAMSGLSFEFRQLESEMDSAVVTIEWGDLNLIDANSVARVEFGGGVGGKIRNGEIRVTGTDARNNDVWIDIIGYYREAANI